jgi:hypothetical protein
MVQGLEAANPAAVGQTFPSVLWSAPDIHVDQGRDQRGYVAAQCGKSAPYQRQLLIIRGLVFARYGPRGSSVQFSPAARDKAFNL